MENDTLTAKSLFGSIPPIKGCDIDHVFIQPKHEAVELPKTVGEWVDSQIGPMGYGNLYRLVGELIVKGSSPYELNIPQAVYSWFNCLRGVDDTPTHNMILLIDAFRYGWKSEPEAKWYVKAPESWKADGGGLDWLYKPSYGGVDVCSYTGESDEQFTRAELKKYHLDSDIFTLVPVEESK